MRGRGKGGIGEGKGGASWTARRRWAGEGGVDSLGRVADDTPVLYHGDEACWREGGEVWGVLGECNGGGRGVEDYSRWGVQREVLGGQRGARSWVGSGWVKMHEPR